jgi:hypothetical protein
MVELLKISYLSEWEQNRYICSESASSLVCRPDQLAVITVL